MRRPFVGLLFVMLTVVGLARPAAAGPIIDEAAAALRKGDPVFVHPDHGTSISAAGADDIRTAIRNGDAPIFVAVLPRDAEAEAGGVGGLPRALGQSLALSGTVAVATPTGFRAASSTVRDAGSIASAAFQAKRSEGQAAVIREFVRRVQAAGGATPSGGDPQPAGRGVGAPSSERGTGGGLLGPVLLLALIGGAVFLMMRTRKRNTKLQADLQNARERLIPSMQALGEDVTNLEPEVAIHEDARGDYEAALTRFRWAQAALPAINDVEDVDVLERALSEGHYAMARVRAKVEGRPAPPPPPDLMAPGPRQAPPVQLDEYGEPEYAGYRGGWRGGGFFGGNDIFTGMLIGSMFGGGFGGWGGGTTVVNNYEGNGDSGGGGFFGDGGDSGGGDWGGGGGGDWGDSGGGDW